MATTNDPGEAAVPAGYRLGDGWYPCDDYGFYCLHDGCSPDDPPTAKWRTDASWACPAHAVELGALVPIEPPVAEPAQPVCSPDCGKPKWVTPGAPAIATMHWCSGACGRAGRPLDPPPVVPPMQPCTHGPGEHPDGCDGDVDSSPAPVPMEATRISAEAFEEWRRQPTTPAPQPAEPAKAPLSAEQLEASVAWARQWINTAGRTPSDYRAFAATVQLADKVAALEAELADAKRHNTINAGFARDFIRERDAARAEVEHLKNQRDNLSIEATKLADEVEQQRAKLADSDRSRTCLVELAQERWTEILRLKREADARVLAMREACKEVVRRRFVDCGKGWGSVVLAVVKDIERLPTSTGTASGAGGEAAKAKGAAAGDDIRARSLELLRAIYYAEEVTTAGIDAIGKLLADADRDVRAQADAIKAAVDKANNRAADAFHDWNRTGNPFSDMTTDEFSAWIRSGADAPGAGKP